MPLRWFPRGSRRLLTVVPLLAFLSVGALPAAADQSDITAAQQQAATDSAAAAAQDTQLSEAQSNLAAAQQVLGGLQHHAADLDATIKAKTDDVDKLAATVRDHQQHLAIYMRTAYEHGPDAAFMYIIGASDLTAAMQRKVEVDHVSTLAHELINQINEEKSAAAQALKDAASARAELDVTLKQAATNEALVAAQEEQIQAQDSAAWNKANLSGQQLADALAAQQQQSSPGSGGDPGGGNQGDPGGPTYTPTPPGDGSNFSIDTDLTQPSGESADNLDAFLQGTPMAGLGGSFMAAEANYHVSARYLVAHAIEESNWGRSRIAQDKHNLFGYNAYDSDPYGSASKWLTFDACINGDGDTNPDYSHFSVASRISHNYLTPGGAYYHGPTLRGMNVSYATDTSWAENIARIARTIP